MNVAHALRLLKEKGYKYTGKREDMLHIFAREARYLSAKELLEMMNHKYPGVSVDTIYRNLSLFAQLGILETTELEGEKRFRYRCDTSTHHHHVICLSCGKTESFQHCPMDEFTRQHFPQFDVTGHKFEVYGRCESCQL
ncbi:Fur family transcriptional regulator [Bacillus sp. FSL W7-1360]